MIFCICGKSCSGKDTILKRLSNHPSLTPVVTMTSRSIRSNEKDGVDYHFVSHDEFDTHEFIEKTIFNGWKYGTPKSSIDLSKNQVIVVNPQGLRSMVDTYGWDNVVAFVIHRKDRDRMLSYLKRDNKASVEEMIRRYHTDNEDFRVFEAWKHEHIHHVDNNHELECAMFEVEAIIGGYLK